VSPDHLGDLAQVSATFARRPLFPEQMRGVGGSHRLVHLIRPGSLDNGDDLTRGGILHRELIVGGSGRPTDFGRVHNGGLLIHGAPSSTVAGSESSAAGSPRSRGRPLIEGCAITVRERNVASESNGQVGIGDKRFCVGDQFG
jgi:hypothetical protein